MASCAKCGKRVRRKRKSDGYRWCPRHGPVEKSSIIKTDTLTHTGGKDDEDQEEDEQGQHAD